LHVGPQVERVTGPTFATPWSLGAAVCFCGLPQSAQFSRSSSTLACCLVFLRAGLVYPEGGCVLRRTPFWAGMGSCYLFEGFHTVYILWSLCHCLLGAAAGMSVLGGGSCAHGSEGALSIVMHSSLTSSKDLGGWLGKCEPVISGPCVGSQPALKNFLKFHQIDYLLIFLIQNP